MLGGVQLASHGLSARPRAMKGQKRRAQLSGLDYVALIFCMCQVDDDLHMHYDDY